MATIEVNVWEQKVFEFGITLPVPELPKPPSDWGTPGLGLDVSIVCPGAAYCGNPDAATNCSIGMKKPLKIPGFSVSVPFPPDIKLPPMKFRVIFPPKVVIAGSCPNYPNKTTPE